MKLPTTKKPAVLLLLLYVFSLYAATALLQDGLFERDGYYHARLSSMVPERGISREFPWTQLSTWKDRYCDKEFLYHLAMMPFTLVGNQPIMGARAFVVLLSTAVIAMLWLVMQKHSVRWPAFFAALPLGMGGLFLARLGMIRSHVLSMLLLLVGVHFLLQRRWRALFVLGFLYAWCYTVPFVLVMTASMFAAGRWLGDDGFDWRAIAAAGLGSVTGLVVHPYSPLTFETFLTYLQVFTIGMEGTGRSGFELGNEIYRYPLPVFFDIYPLIVILVPLLAGFVLVRRKYLAPATLGLSTAAFGWFAMTVAAPRFVEYSVLLLTLALAFVVRDTVALPGAAERLRIPKGRRIAIAVVAIVLLLGFHVYSMRFYTYYQSKVAPPRFFEGASRWMAQNLTPGETVINLFWDDFPDLFYAAPQQHYLWGLDPTYTIRYDRDRALKLENFRRHLVPLDGPSLAELFQSHWIVLRANRAIRYAELTKPPFREVYRDPLAVVYHID